MTDFARFSYFVLLLKQVKKNGKKVEKKVFLTVYPGLKSEFLRPKTFLKNFIYAFKTPVKKVWKNICFHDLSGVPNTGSFVRV
jgi:hypothetical protein